MKIEKIKKVVIQLTLLGCSFTGCRNKPYQGRIQYLVVSEKNDLRQLARTASYQVFQKIDSIDFFMKDDIQMDKNTAARKILLTAR
jgi:hypothetical protein